MKTFALPDLGEGLPDAEIVEWHVKVGQTVKLDEPLVSMETAKAVVEVPSPYTGTIAKLYGKPGDVIDTGAALVDFDGQAEGRQSGTVAGELEQSDTVLTEATAKQALKRSSVSKGVKATPAVRALAQRLDIDLTTVKPTGAGGIITAEDVRQADKSVDIGPSEPIRGVRRAMVKSMTDSHASVVPATVMDEADITDWKAGEDITVRLIQAIVKACEQEPALNAWFTANGPARRVFEEVHVGMAMDTPEGLFVPVIHNAGQYDAKALREQIQAIKAAVSTREISQDQLQGNTITLSNFGKFAGQYASPVVVPPTVAILAVGRLLEVPRVIDGQMQVRRCLPLSLTFDHRAVTGGEAARFLGCLMEALR